MKLSISQQYTQTTQQSSFFLSKTSTEKSAEMSANTIQEAKFTSFKLKIQLFSKSETNEQNSEFKIFQSATPTELPVEHTPEQNKPKSFLDIFEEGYWGTKQTSDRLANFVINGAGDNLEKMRMGREGIIRGFKEAEKLWGGKLPEISYTTLDKALAKIDERIHSYGQPVIDLAA